MPDTTLADQIRQSTGPENSVSTTLTTDERVIARVTDGIYRQPGSALRELISNAYDADATYVAIKTDAPRFDRIVIEDDGQGMTPEVVAHLLKHIGGSSKRNNFGAELGVASENNPMMSPGGRRLIGKIGIGLFSVSQLTHRFQIITKTKGDNYRTIALVAMRQYADEDVIPQSDGGSGKFESGKVRIWRESAADEETHGTTVVLTDIRRQARDTLRSREIWDAIDRQGIEDDDKETIALPKFHIGRVTNAGDVLNGQDQDRVALPWTTDDTPDEAFRKLVRCIWSQLEAGIPNPKLDMIFDYYLQMVWQLSLAIPLPYAEGHLFDQPNDEWADVFRLSNEVGGAAQSIAIKSNSLRTQFGLDDRDGVAPKFDVFFDNLKLSRPIRFRDLPVSSNALKKPLVFLGQCREEFAGVSRELSSGPLQFEAYLFWNPKIAPVEHQGVLIRIHGSSGTLFDSTFLRYQVSEQTRLRQTMCEIFVSEGLDSALNIDRESFNHAHPHAIYITKWLHSALRQLASTQKKLAAVVRSEQRQESASTAVTRIEQIATEFWKSEFRNDGSSPPGIELLPNGQNPTSTRDSYVFNRDVVVSDSPKPATEKARAKSRVLEQKLKAIGQILASFGLFDSVPKATQEKLLKAIYEILEAPED